MSTILEDGLSYQLAVVHSLHARNFPLDRLLLLLEEAVAGVEFRLAWLESKGP